MTKFCFQWTNRHLIRATLIILLFILLSTILTNLKRQLAICKVSSYLKNIDDSNKGFQIFAYMTSDNTKFIYLSPGKEESREPKIKQMLNDLHYYYANVQLIDCNESSLQNKQWNKKPEISGSSKTIAWECSKLEYQT